MNSKKILLLGILAGLSVLGYLLISQQFYGIGFPLDDSWIHQSYARNLGNHGEWSFILGERSAGATAPLWVLLLAVGYFLNIDPMVWTFLLGWGILWTTAFLCSTLFGQMLPKHRKNDYWIGIIILL